MSYTHKEEELDKLTMYAKIALATICIERGLDLVVKDKKLHKSISEMIHDLWKWQDAGKVSGKNNMTEDESRKLPSYYFYDKYSEVLLKVPSDQKANFFVRGTNVLHVYICWEMDGLESLLNSDKPFVLGNDIMDASMFWLVDGLERMIHVANNPESEASWQKRAVDKLLKFHSVEGEQYIGSPVSGIFFEEL